MRRIAATIGLLGALALALFGLGSGSSGGYEIRGIFDNGAFLVSGEDVRVAGATVGTVASVNVTKPGEPARRDGSPDPGKAVVVMKITNAGFQDFRRDASCLIRPASLLGEKYVDCKPTQPRAPAVPPAPPLRTIPAGEPGAGQRLLPLENNGKEVDLDLVNNIMREPYVDRFRLILNDLGAGLAARGQDLEAIIRRADPALRQTDRVLAVLARQRHTLSRLATDSDRILAPLARERERVAGFINNANATAAATAERNQALDETLRRFPGALRELRLTMAKLRGFSVHTTPVVEALRTGAPAIARATRALGPFAHEATPALRTLGAASEQSQQPIVASDPMLRKIRDLATVAAPGAKSLNRLLASLRRTGGYRRLMTFLFNSVGSVNGYDRYGHFLRAGLQITTCTTLLSTPLLSCDANFGRSGASAKVAAPQPSVTESPPAGDAGEAAGGTGQPLDAAGDPAGGGIGAKPDPEPTRRPPSIRETESVLDTVIGSEADTGTDEEATP